MSFQFFSSSQNGTTAPLGSQAQPKARSEDKQTVLPVTIRAIETAVQQEGDEVLFYGSQPETLIVVASVESCKKLPNNLDLVVNDGTGRIRVRQFLTGESDTQTEGIQPGRYVHIFGGVRRKPELHFAAQGIRPVATADEVSYHMIEVAHAALRLQRGEPAAAPVITTPVKTQAAQDSEMTPPKAPEPAAQVSAAEAAPAATGSLSGTALREAIMKLLEQQADIKGEEGVSKIEVMAHFKTSSELEVGSLLSDLVSDGDAITTIDDDHFAAV